jgi:AcrR family transcriptional regulator
MSRSSRPSPLKPRKAPSQPRAAETVASIIEAAAQVLESAGFEGFNTNAVARRAGVSIGSLYQYFPSKDALTIALMRREAKLFYEDASRGLEQPTGEAAMDYLISAAVRQQLRRPVLARLLDVEESRPALRREAAGPETFQTLLATIIGRDGMPRQTRPDLAAADLIAIIRGMVDGAGERGEKDVTDLGRRVRAAVFGYLSGSASFD